MAVTNNELRILQGLPLDLKIMKQVPTLKHCQQ